MNEDNIEVLKAIVACILVIALFCLFALWENKKTCEAKGEIMKNNVQWGMYTGCMVEHKPGYWVPIEQYRIIKAR